MLALALNPHAHSRHPCCLLQAAREASSAGAGPGLGAGQGAGQGVGTGQSQGQGVGTGTGAEAGPVLAAAPGGGSARELAAAAYHQLAMLRSRATASTANGVRVADGALKLHKTAVDKARALPTTRRPSHSTRQQTTLGPCSDRMPPR